MKSLGCKIMPLFILMMSCMTGEGISENTDFFIGIWELKSATDEKGRDISVPAGIDIVFEDENDGLDFYGGISVAIDTLVEFLLSSAIALKLLVWVRPIGPVQILLSIIILKRSKSESVCG